LSSTYFQWWHSRWESWHSKGRYMRKQS
jgi:hypothetical protein